MHHELRGHAGHAQRLPQGAVTFGRHAEKVDVGVLAGDACQVVQAHFAGRAIGRMQHQKAALAGSGKLVLVGACLCALAEVLGEGGGVLEFSDRIHVGVPS